MAVSVTWDNDEHTIIHMEFDGRWTWDEVKEAVQTSHTMTAPVEHPIDVIADMSKSIGVPSLALPHARNLIAGHTRKTSMIVVVGASPAISTLWQVFAQAYHWLTRDERFVFARTLEEARQRLAARTRPLV